MSCPLSTTLGNRSAWSNWLPTSGVGQFTGCYAADLIRVITMVTNGGALPLCPVKWSFIAGEWCVHTVCAYVSVCVFPRAGVSKCVYSRQYSYTSSPLVFPCPHPSTPPPTRPLLVPFLQKHSLMVLTSPLDPQETLTITYFSSGCLTVQLAPLRLK